MKPDIKNIKLKTKDIKVHKFKTVDSTNNAAKKLAENGCDEGVVVMAHEQTNGRGRLGRTFLSQKGGVYFSVVLRPDFTGDTSLFITVAAAVAAAQAIEEISGKKCEIKWVNDVYMCGKKVCGILTEGGFNQNGSLDYAILGVGINLFAPKDGFPAELPLADSVFGKSEKFLFKTLKKRQLISSFLKYFFCFYENLEKKEYIAQYQNKSFLTGKQITYKKENQKLSATVVGIDNDARLVVERDSQKEILSFGEIQIVGMEQLEI